MSFTHSCENNKPFTASSLSSAPTSTSQLSFEKSVKSETFISTCLICYFNCIKVINIVYSKMQWSAMYWAYVKYIIGGYALITGQKLDWTSPYIITAGFKLDIRAAAHSQTIIDQLRGIEYAEVVTASEDVNSCCNIVAEVHYPPVIDFMYSKEWTMTARTKTYLNKKRCNCFICNAQLWTIFRSLFIPSRQ